MATTISRPPRRGPRPDPERRARRAEEILVVATDHFSRRGFHNTDIQDLADELGAGKGTIYRCFATKEVLFLAAVDRVMRQLGDRLDAVLGSVPDPLDRIETAVRAYLAFFDAHPQYVELLIQERAVFRDRQQPTYFLHREQRIERWRGLYRELIAAGRVRPLPPAQITDVMSSALYGTMFTNFFAGRKKSLEQQAGELIEIIFHGILTEAERARRISAAAEKERG